MFYFYLNFWWILSKLTLLLYYFCTFSFVILPFLILFPSHFFNVHKYPFLMCFNNFYLIFVDRIYFIYTSFLGTLYFCSIGIYCLYYSVTNKSCFNNKWCLDSV
ncbi:hypothetical protein EDI_206620 [Entamoeba dispar SAW760]|uniref:Uncharacterized protein n=1 Tax=Entamoeba dispar (strain ATCC PRA-260 / SAW760) TaxID=370354 RepID=B0EL36_ENTDS|nr:uncharacterized protein EDI_206620 [Entamoeba dispar SAW760]EDR24724.1 hypothetical protein EDI_206620 [Entamoeba dispar SAW760]|eukprot:EDR24724.1 hypothetical protein EDI_206620 [Entamoeba dispar SAW760]